MKLVIFLDITIILMISFILSRKTLHIFENIFLFFVTDILFLSYMAVLYNNTDFLELSQEIDLHIIFRLYEVINIPLLTIWYFNYLSALKNTFGKWVLTICYLFAVYAVEYLFLKWEVISYNGWNACLSIIGMILMLLIIGILKNIFKRTLRKEEIQ